MVETNWRAVVLGFVVITALGILSTAVPALALLGGLVGAVVGGAAAGYYAHSGRWNGAWNGFLAGAIGALALTAVLVVLGLATSIVSLSLGGVFATVGLALAALVIIAVAAIPATVGGFVGGLFAREGMVEEMAEDSDDSGRPSA